MASGVGQGPFKFSTNPVINPAAGGTFSWDTVDTVEHHKRPSYLETHSEGSLDRAYEGKGARKQELKSWESLIEGSIESIESVVSEMMESLNAEPKVEGLVRKGRLRTSYCLEEPEIKIVEELRGYGFSEECLRALVEKRCVAFKSVDDCMLSLNGYSFLSDLLTVLEHKTEELKGAFLTLSILMNSSLASEEKIRQPINSDISKLGIKIPTLTTREFFQTEKGEPRCSDEPIRQSVSRRALMRDMANHPLNVVYPETEEVEFVTPDISFVKVDELFLLKLKSELKQIPCAQGLKKYYLDSDQIGEVVEQLKALLEKTVEKQGFEYLTPGKFYALLHRSFTERGHIVAITGALELLINISPVSQEAEVLFETGVSLVDMDADRIEVMLAVLLKHLLVCNTIADVQEPQLQGSI